MSDTTSTTPFVGVKEAASMLGVPYAWLKAQVDEGLIPCIPTPGRVLLHLGQLEQALQDRAKNTRRRITKEQPPIRIEHAPDDLRSVSGYVERAWGLLPAKMREGKPDLLAAFLELTRDGHSPGSMLNALDRAYNHEGVTELPGRWLRRHLAPDRNGAPVPDQAG